MQSYQNQTDYPQVIPNVGNVPPRGIIETDLELNNPNFKRITNQLSVAPPIEVPQLVQAAPEQNNDEEKV